MAEVDLEFSDFLGKFNDLGKSAWITVYEIYRKDNNSRTFYCAMIADQRVKKRSSYPSWDLHIGGGFPGFSINFENDEKVETYYRHSAEDVEPLIVSRDFHGMKDDYREVSEEFRYYFNLFEDRRNNKFVFIDDNGDDEDAIIITNQKIKIKLRFIKEFLAVKKMHLALFFELNRYSAKTIEELGIQECQEEKFGDDFAYVIGVHNWRGLGDSTIKSHGRLMGKKLISGLKDFQPDLYDKIGKKFAEFIIGTDKDGKEITHTCDEEKLGKKKGSPHSLTPVFFRKDVLTKYYSQADKYSVEDGYLRCGFLWSLHIDNNLDDYVMVFLYHLGHLSYKEQLHWQSYNVAAEPKISRTEIMRGIKGEFADPEKSDLYFKQTFTSFQKKWEKKFGWKLFIPLKKEDDHNFKSLHLPLNNEQKEFDDQVGALVKVFIDSLNEKELTKGVEIPKNNLKGLGKFELFLSSRGFVYPEMFKFLRNLQKLRSAGVAHRKGDKYEKVKKFFSIEEEEFITVFDDILMKCIWTLNTLESKLIK